MGIESDKPLISKEILDLNFTNEGGVEGTTRFLKNIMGMWLLQECRRVWSREINYSWGEMVDLSILAQPFKCLIDPDDPSFLNPADMPEAIIHFCLKTGQTPPETHGEFIRCIFESLAMKYRITLDSIRSVVSYPIEKVHIIGGGANNELLCQYSANALELPRYLRPHGSNCDRKYSDSGKSHADSCFIGRDPNNGRKFFSIPKPLNRRIRNVGRCN